MIVGRGVHSRRSRSRRGIETERTESAKTPRSVEVVPKQRTPKRIGSFTAIVITVVTVFAVLIVVDLAPYPVQQHRSLSATATETTSHELYYLAPFVSDFAKDSDKNVTSCSIDTTMLLLEEWKANRQPLVCNYDGGNNNVYEQRVDRYVLDRWEGHPTILRYVNATFRSSSGPPWSSAAQAQYYCAPFSQNQNGPIAVTTREDRFVNATLIRIALYDPYNSYERFHAYVNVAILMIMFDVRDPQLVFVGPNATQKVDEGDQQVWRLFSNLAPRVATIDDDEDENGDRYTYRFREIIDAPSSELSMVNTRSAGNNNRGNLLGRGVDHHCESSLFRGILAWLYHKMEATTTSKEEKESSSQVIPKFVSTPTTITATTGKQHTMHTPRRRRILWSSRQPYCCRSGATWTPNRILGNETEFLNTLSETLGPNYDVQAVDFGALSPYQSMRIASSSDVLVGVHGAGLVWSAFLPHRGGLVEVFASDRPPTNRHYHNLASLVGIPYRETKHWAGSSKVLRWNNNRVHEVATLIRGLEEE